MSSAAAGGQRDISGHENHAEAFERACPNCGRSAPLTATSAVSAEAQQGDGPGAASASGSAAGEGVVQTISVSVVVGPSYAAAAGPFGVVAVGPRSAAAASEVGVAAVAPNGAAATSNAANSSEVAVFAPFEGDHDEAGAPGRVRQAQPTNGPRPKSKPRQAGRR